MNTPLKTDTKCHLALENILISCGFRVEKEAFFNPFWIDCYIDEFYVGFEADSIYHSRKRDKKRDQYLLEYYNLPVKRFGDKTLLNKSKRDNIRSDIMDFVFMYSDSAQSRREKVIKICDYNGINL